MNNIERTQNNLRLFWITLCIIIIVSIIVAIFISVEFAGIIVAIALALAGLFQDFIRSIFYSPALKTHYEPVIPYAHKVSHRSGLMLIGDSYYFRIKIENTGNAALQDIEIIVEKCEKELSSGVYEPIEEFLPLNLSWSHKPSLAILPAIRDGFYWFCSFGYITKAGNAYPGLYDKFRDGINAVTLCTLDTIPKPNSGEHILCPGDYRLGLVIIAKNLKPERRTVHLHLEDGWEDDRSEMFRRNILSVNEFEGSL